MNHTTMHQYLSAYVDHELGEAEAKALSEHLSGCTSCQQRMKDMESIRLTIKDAATANLPDNFAYSVLRSVRQEQQESVVWLGTERLARNVVVALCILVFAVVAFGSFLKPAQTFGVDRYLSGEPSDSAAHAVLGSQQAISKEDVMIAALTK